MDKNWIKPKLEIRFHLFFMIMHHLKILVKDKLNQYLIFIIIQVMYWIDLFFCKLRSIGIYIVKLSCNSDFDKIQHKELEGNEKLQQNDWLMEKW